VALGRYRWAMTSPFPNAPPAPYDGPSGRLRRARRPHVVVFGDLLLDVVVAPERAVARGTDVPGHVLFRQGGSAATTARWVARLGGRVTLVCAVGRDAVGRALIEAIAAEGARVRAARVSGARTGRIGVVLAPDGERSFVADRGAADQLAADDLEPAWFSAVALLHLPAYSLLGQPLGAAGQRAIELARSGGALVSLDLASSRPLLAGGRRRAANVIRRIEADVLFASGQEADALLGGGRPEGLIELAPIVVVKRGAQGASILAQDGSETLRFEVATHAIQATDSTGAGDAFDAGFIVSWLDSLAAGRPAVSSLQRATLAGHRAAARHLAAPAAEIRFR